MKKTFLTLLLLISFPLVASHIVGGEFELVHISDNLYQLNLIIYFDDLNGSPAAQDQFVTARIFRKRDNTVMGQITLPFQKDEPVNYTQPACSNGEIVTRKLYYTSTLTLSPSTFNDPEGYYVSWERCCRNYSISNIYSDPPGGTRFAGQTFYLEFPPVVKNGEPFINNSPRLFPPLNDYACPFRPYYVDFAGTDDDGDSLVYSLVDPLNTFTGEALPLPDFLPRPGPYNPIQWKPGFGINNIINGAPDLKISTDGFLTVTPTSQGLYVFAVRCEEYRNREKIGEVRRDFQMLVVDRCPQAEPPQITGKKLTDASFTYDNKMSVSFANNVLDGDRCIQVRVSDPDASKLVDNFSEKISIRAVSLNFKKNVREILPAVTSATLLNGSTKDFTICFPQCPYFEGGPYQVGIIVFDDACSLPLSDTLKIEVTVQPPANTEPYFVKPIDLVTSVTLNEGGFYESDFEIRDDENDELIVSITNNGFVLADAGFTVQIDEPRVNGIVKGKIRWDAYCDIFDFTKRTYFEVNILVNDKNTCDSGKPVTATFKFNVLLPGNADPFIDTDLTTDPQERQVLNIETRINESLSFTVTGKDLVDNDLLALDVNQRNLFNSLGISFPSASGTGQVSSLFEWNLSCANIDLKVRDSYAFQFIVVDNSNKCRIYKADTVDVYIKILPPLNTAPQLVIQNSTAVVNDQTVSFTLGEQISFNLTGTDADVVPDKDLLKLTLIESKGNVAPEGFAFIPATGKGKVESVFSWLPDCSVFKSNVYENVYTFKFRVGDDRCFNIKADTVSLTIRLKDVYSSDDDFLPPNVFTPNGDGCNDYFAVEGIEPCPFNPDQGTNPDEVVSFPPDNCIRQFESVRIFNRWGNQVFESKDRKFRWYAPDYAAGVYFYTIKFTDKEFKGSLSVRF
jgi:CHU_C Type IX secretion signal domain